MIFRATLTLLIAGTAVGQRPSQAPDAIRIEKLTNEENARREAIKEKIAAAQSALDELERQIATKHGAEL